MSRIKPVVVAFVVLSVLTVAGIVKQGLDLQNEKDARVTSLTQASTRQDRLESQAQALAKQVQGLGKTPIVTPEEIASTGSGKQGQQGIQGVQGEQGVPGLTPTFSELQALFASYCGARNSCKGPKGDTGLQGTQGVGLSGKDGKDGSNGADGKDSTVPGPQGNAGTGIASVTCDGALPGTTFHFVLSDGSAQDVPCS